MNEKHTFNHKNKFLKKILTIVGLFLLVGCMGISTFSVRAEGTEEPVATEPATSEEIEETPTIDEGDSDTVVEETPESEDEEVTSNDAGINMASADGIELADISGTTTIEVGVTTTLTGTSDYYGNYQHFWSSSNSNIASVSGNGSSATVTGVSEGTVTITHQYKRNYDRFWSEETITVTVTGGSSSGERAMVFYLATPTSNAYSNDSSQWKPDIYTHDTFARVNTTGATWDNDKNVLENVSDYIVSWPDGSTDGTHWTVKRDDEKTGSFFKTILSEIWDSYKADVNKDVEGAGLTEDDITEITIYPFKISKNNGTSPDKHVDCTISIKSNKVYAAQFWVSESDSYKTSDYTMVGAKYFKTDDPVSLLDNTYWLNGEKITDADNYKIGTTRVNRTTGLTEVLTGWYTEKDDEPHSSTIVESWPYNPSDTEKSNGTVSFYAYWKPQTTSVTVSKSVTGGLGDKNKKFSFSYSYYTLVDGVKTQKSETKTLKDGESFKFENVLVGTAVTVTETDATGYVTKYKVNNDNETTSTSFSVNSIDYHDGSNIVAFTNNKDVVPDVGISLDNWPYIILLGIVVVGSACYFTKKRRNA